MKRTERVGALIKILTDNPNKIYSLGYFCKLFDAAKSSVSEDIQAATEAIAFTGSGFVETISGAKGGVRFIPDISDEETKALTTEFVKRLSNPNRLLGGNFVYTSDIFCDPAMIKPMATVFAKKFRNCGADHVITVETKGIPLAFTVAQLMGLPLVVIRREARFSEGSTVSINYFSGSDERIQKMSMSKRAIAPGSKVLIIDDFMRGGGSIVGITNMVHEFGSKVVGAGVAIASLKPERKKVENYVAIAYVGEVSSETGILEVLPNENL